MESRAREYRAGIEIGRAQQRRRFGARAQDFDCQRAHACAHAFDQRFTAGEKLLETNGGQSRFRS